MKSFFTAVFLLAFLWSFSQTTSGVIIPSARYSWKEPSKKIDQNLLVDRIFEGSAHDFAYIAMDAYSLIPSDKRPTGMVVPLDEEQLIMIKSGLLDITFGDSSWSIGPGSIALLLPGEKYTIQTSGKAATDFYLMSYRSKELVNVQRGIAAGGSFVRDWKKLRFRAHDRGGVRSYFERPTAMSKRFEMHVTTLKPNLKSHEPHTHRAEEIILMLTDETEGKSQTEMLIGDTSFQGGPGDLYYVGTNLLHGIKNIGEVSCSYFAFQFE